ncbi:MAG TPA: PstS family phosphate ABC transporter substrate-binding protein [Thermoleophilaceae bacterium]|nr:PstS family phosphate ABC transporter substrate-binding protein [Thermoleophilaceae bacterium]
MTKWLALATAGVLAFGVAACGGDSDSSASGSSGGGELSGKILIDGSSTVAPLSEPAAELFMEENPGVTITVGTSGTGGGFEKFCTGETDISDASRPIEEDETAMCKSNGITSEQLAVANDALTVVVNPDNPVDCITVDQLRQIWEPKSKVTNWSQIDGLQGAPDAELDLYGPGTDSGTFDYFTDAVNGEEGASRTDYNNVGEDDNATVTGVSGSEGGMGYFGYSFYTENEGTLKALEVDGGDGCVAPSPETTQDGSYKPLGRQLFIYPSAKALKRPEVKAFVEFYIENAAAIAEQAGFIGLTQEQVTEAQEKVAKLAG